MVSGSPLPGEEGDEVLTMVGKPGAASLRVECRFGVWKNLKNPGLVNLGELQNGNVNGIIWCSPSTSMAGGRWISHYNITYYIVN